MPVRWPAARPLAPSLLLAGALLWPAAAEAQPAGAHPAVPQRLLVKLRAPRLPVASHRQLPPPADLGREAGVALRHLRSAGAFEVYAIESAHASDVRAAAQRLMHHPRVELAEPDRWMRPALVPNDPRYYQQWQLHQALSEIAGANSPGAWDLSTGRPAVAIAVVDTGLLPHSDLDGARALPGYDFISDPLVANDGDGRDADATDAGDWVSEEEAALLGALCTQVHERSSWHGTLVAGIIAASGNNGTGIAGVNWGSSLLPVRVLGRCGGWMSDVVDALRWAAGMAVPGVPRNPAPARVINLSLGAEGPCSPFLQQAIDDAIRAGAVVVAAAGNGPGGTVADAARIAPGNCAGVVAVGSVDRSGNRTWYSRAGETVGLSAPGFAWSLSNLGATSPQPEAVGSVYAAVRGTSVSAALVSGVASLVVSVNPGLSPAQVSHALRAGSRPFPDGSDCSGGGCGAGMLDAHAAVAAASAMPAAAAGPGSSACFIATAAYGTPDASELSYLRAFRDRYLLTNAPGRALVAAYYALGPSLARAIRPSPALRAIVRLGLVPYVALARWLLPAANDGNGAARDQRSGQQARRRMR